MVKPDTGKVLSCACAPSWRFIPLLQASGDVQMAIDRWLLQQHGAGLHPPTLRFYTMSPPALSLGYHQHRWPEFWQQIKWQGMPVDVVRRPTGGRAVLHQGDLTYAVVTSKLAGNRIQAYQAICGFLIAGWRSLGIELHYGDAGRSYIHNPNCFGNATGADLVTDAGVKLIGSAQLRRDGAILQHGSMRLQPDIKLFSQVFGEEATPAALSLNMSIETIINALVAAAGCCFGVELVMQPLTEAEWQEIHQLVRI
ncbi:lipoate--protein ligase family protein [Microcoleus sp. FACHB-68]|nr:biotin/lipoate A/B protein ligase family protein [Microcoleus sp. FACHB-68]MBD1939673.1 lipoate--protein ligase family protein [Microcoleus sp. FACHB-68]